MWNQVYNPFNNQTLSTIAAALPVVTLLVLIASNKVKAHLAAVIALVVDDNARVVGVKTRAAGSDAFVEARKGVVLAAGSFNLNADITGEHMPLFAQYGKPLGEPTNDGAGLLLGGRGRRDVALSRVHGRRVAR